MAKLRSGKSVANITPPVGLYLTGFGGRAGPSNGIHDEIYAKTIVISDGNEDLAIVTTDLLGFDADVVKAIKEGADKLGIPAKNIMLCSSHTHSGPVTVSLRGLGYRDENYVLNVEKKILGSIDDALSNTQESVLRIGEGKCEIGVNRREKTKDGKIVLGENPLGPIDPAITTITIESPAGRTVLFSYACHPVVLGSSNLLISADYPGYATKVIESVWKGSVAMFIQGCCGNINSKVVGGSFDDAERLGGILGKEVTRVAERSGIEEGLPLCSSIRKVELPLQELPSEEEIEKERIEYSNRLSLAKQRNQHGDIILWEGFLEWADTTSQLIRKGERHLNKEIELQVMRVGETAIAAIPGEPFIEIALGVKERSKFKHTIVAGYTNGCIGYMPTPEAIEQGGYEVDTAHKLYDIAPLAPSAFRIIVETAAQLCDEVRKIN